MCQYKHEKNAIIFLMRWILDNNKASVVVSVRCQIKHLEVNVIHNVRCPPPSPLYVLHVDQASLWRFNRNREELTIMTLCSQIALLNEIHFSCPSYYTRTHKYVIIWHYKKVEHSDGVKYTKETQFMNNNLFIIL